MILELVFIRIVKLTLLSSFYVLVNFLFIFPYVYFVYDLHNKYIATEAQD